MHQEIFPQWLWDELSREGHIWVEGHPKADLSTTPASHRFFMLRALLVRYYCVPTFRVEDLAARIVNGESSGFVPPLIPYDMRPMLTIHLRKTDKGVEDPYWVAHRKYRPVEVWIEAVRGLISAPIKWKSLFIMSDDDTARDSLLVQLANEGITEGMNVIKDEWVLQQKSDKGQAIDHMHIRKHFKQEAMQHFVAQLFVAAHSDYSITTQSSNVGKFIMEMTATAKRMTQVGEIGSLGTSLDCSFIEASTHCCNFKLKTTGPYKTPQERKCKDYNATSVFEITHRRLYKTPGVLV
mmetsp:Transcript_883/g.3216  ORF Transcript_883/g.3216 Transcript_883/m.3216 type:complete len:295 (+) Transcript_883:262-1146(+)